MAAKPGTPKPVSRRVLHLSDAAHARRYLAGLEALRERQIEYRDLAAEEFNICCEDIEDTQAMIAEVKLALRRHDG